MKTNRLAKSVFAACVALTLSVGALFGQTITSLNDIKYWVGSGINQAALVIDWKDGESSASLAWGYRWNGSATGEDMLRAIAGFIGTDASSSATADGTGDTNLTLYTVFFAGFGNSVYQLDYNLGDIAHSDGGFEADTTGYWAYYTAGGTTLLPTIWTFSDVGMRDRVLTNNSWDAWTWAEDFNGTPPDVPKAAAVPEPGTIPFLLLGTVIVIRQIRRRHA